MNNNKNKIVFGLLSLWLLTLVKINIYGAAELVQDEYGQHEGVELQINPGSIKLAEMADDARLQLDKALVRAAYCGSEDTVKQLLDKGAQVNTIGFLGDTPLIFAIYDNNKKLFEILLDNKAKVDITNEFGNTPLMIAVLKNNREIIKLLLNSNCDLSVVNKENETAMDIARRLRFLDIIELLEDEPFRRASALERRKEIEMIFNGIRLMPRELTQFIRSYLPLELADYIECEEQIKIINLAHT